MIYKLEELKHEPSVRYTQEGQDKVIGYSAECITLKFLYFTVLGHEIIFSTDFFELCDYRRAHGGENTPYYASFEFFIHKGYEPFDSTIVTEVYKIPNLFELVVSGLRFKYRRIDLYVKPQDEKQLVIRAIQKSFHPQKKNIILFSGGYDSTLLAKIAKDAGFDAELANGAYQDNLSSNDSIEKAYSNRLASYLQLPYRVVTLNQTDFTLEDIHQIVESQPNTAHYSLVFYALQKVLGTESYNIISGQQADSVLNYGSTSMMKMRNFKPEGLGELLRRFLYMTKTSLLPILFSVLNKEPSRYKQGGMLVGFRKLPIIRNQALFNSFTSLFDRFLAAQTSESEILDNNMVFYAASFLQGSDASGISNIIQCPNNPLPFSDLELVKFYANKKNMFRDVFYPKRVIHELLKENPELYNVLREKPNIQAISYENRFAQLLEHLDLRPDYQRLAERFHIPGDITYNKYHLAHCLDKVNGTSSKHN